ncbi:TPR repeat domain protein [Candidatus Rhodobacter oscarellae]|uniref:Tetratricopeptide repeat protein 38 n=1 Tax=Candidatus Rhodobacter oscarellae TaxID=1675527 RepID=A0A0J9EAD0_9RHOB|nr:tetratricopeptide repeat protein [Candidatus Rhodobacter lobularis]KMW59586.1 TPR repeat domain protein [Candidatus Rhodobacter lobularis]
MALTDRYGKDLATSSEVARDKYIEGVDHILAATYGAVEAFSEAVEADPGFTLGHVGLARARMNAADMTGAKASIARAKELAASGDARQKSFVGCVALVLGGKPVEARKAVAAHVLEHPTDALIAQMSTNIFGLIGFSGLPGREAELLAYTSALLPHYGDDWWMQSMHALSLCETGQLDAALTLMETALASNPANANGSHFKAHTLYEQGETAIGLAFLQDWMQGYDSRAILHGHLSWHSALWSLEQGDIDAVWAVMDAAIAPEASSSLPINALTDSAALLHRAELAGFEVAPARWKAISDYANNHFAKPSQSFADMHSALAHAMAGEGERLARIAEASRGFAADLVRPVARAWGAMARQDWQAALTDLAALMPDHARIGGSRAQRDLLELSYAHCLLKLGHTDEARRHLSICRPVFAEGAPVAALH